MYENSYFVTCVINDEDFIKKYEEFQKGDNKVPIAMFYTLSDAKAHLKMIQDNGKWWEYEGDEKLVNMFTNDEIIIETH